MSARRVVLGWLVAIALLSLVEVSLRCAGFPRGTFRGIFAAATDGGGLWQPGFSGVLHSGPIPYRVEANAHGFRGGALRSDADAADLRVVAIGDSMTDGFYVDNESTYPQQLGRVFEERGLSVEVINAARGAGSIDRFGAILRELALPLDPDVVLVTFVSNDLGELGSFPLVRCAPEGSADWRSAGGLVPYFVTRTAIGESLMQLLLGLRSARPRASPGELRGADRYRILGGEDFATNARIFEDRYARENDRGDGLAIAESLSPVGLRAFELYFELLRNFRDECRAREVGLLFLYMPAYSELYAAESPVRETPGKDLLLRELAQEGIHTLDLTRALREASGFVRGGNRTALHLAPVDFHLNPRGNRVVATAVADELLASGLLERTPGR